MTFTIYGRPNCTFCMQATALLDRKNISYSYYNLMEMEPIQTQHILGDSGMRTVPIIYRDGECIGGFEQLKEIVPDEDK